MIIDYFDYSLIPDVILENIKEYVENGRPLGGFLYAIFTNDLWAATGRADSINLPLIPLYVNYIHNQTPFGCHGNCYMVKKWMESKQKQREKNEETSH